MKAFQHGIPTVGAVLAATLTRASDLICMLCCTHVGPVGGLKVSRIKGNPWTGDSTSPLLNGRTSQYGAHRRIRDKRLLDNLELLSCETRPAALTENRYPASPTLRVTINWNPTCQSEISIALFRIQSSARPLYLRKYETGVLCESTSTEILICCWEAQP